MNTFLTISNPEKYILFSILILCVISLAFSEWRRTWKFLTVYNKTTRIFLISALMIYFFYVIKIFQEWANTAKPYLGVGKMMHEQLADIFIKELTTNNFF